MARDTRRVLRCVTCRGRRGWTALLLVSGLVACDARRAEEPPRQTIATGRRVDTVGADAERWDVAKVEARLREADLAPVQRVSDVRQPFLSVPGTILRIGDDAQVQVFLYDDARAVGRDVERLDTARVAPPTMMITWVMPPSLVTSENMAAIVLTRDETLRRRVHAALGEPYRVRDQSTR